MRAYERTECFFNLSIDERIDYFKRRQGLHTDNVFRTYFGCMMLPFGMFGAILTSLFIATIYRAMKSRVVSRKTYVLLMNRAVGDLLSCLVAVVVSFYVLFLHELNYDMVILMESFFTGSFWSAMVTYVALSVLKFFAVWKPFSYRKWFTMERCVHVTIFSWIMFILMISYTLGVSALVKIPALNEWSGCKMETCVMDMYRARSAVIISVYLFTLVVFVITVLLLRRAEAVHSPSFNKRDSVKSNCSRRIRFPLWKLTLNVSTFAGFYLFYVIWCIGILLIKNNCFYERHFTEMMRILAFVRTTVLLRIVVDPLLTFVTDYQLRRTFLLMIGVNGKAAFCCSRLIHQSPTMETIDSNFQTTVKL